MFPYDLELDSSDDTLNSDFFDRHLVESPKKLPDFHSSLKIFRQNSKCKLFINQI